MFKIELGRKLCLMNFIQLFKQINQKLILIKSVLKFFNILLVAYSDTLNKYNEIIKFHQIIVTLISQRLTVLCVE